MKKTEHALIGEVMAKLNQACPPLMARRTLPQLLGGTISSGTLANAESAGYGPPCIRSGRNAIYEKDSFLQWFRIYLEGGLQAVKIAYTQRE